MWQVVKALRPHPLSVGQARNFCTRRLESVLRERGQVADAVADAAMIASELVTNAIAAGASAIELALTVGDSTLRVEVSDDAQGEVMVAAPSHDEPKGRGLMIVAALARDWGVSSDDGLKRVWAEIAIPPRPGSERGDVD